GMAEVFRARDRSLDRPVALKVFRAAEADKVRFQRETALLTQLQHPHLVRLLDAGEFDGVAYIALELADGPTLATSLRGGPLSPDRVAPIGASIAGALAYLHG